MEGSIASKSKYLFQGSTAGVPLPPQQSPWKAAFLWTCAEQCPSFGPGPSIGGIFPRHLKERLGRRDLTVNPVHRSHGISRASGQAQQHRERCLVILNPIPQLSFRKSNSDADKNYTLTAPFDFMMLKNRLQLNMRNIK